MSAEFSNFKSAIVWPKDRYVAEEIPTGEFKPFRTALLKAIEAAAESFTMAGVTESPIETFFGTRFALRARRLCDALGWKFSVGTREMMLTWSCFHSFLLSDFALILRYE
jgi:hypothetical protein